MTDSGINTSTSKSQSHAQRAQGHTPGPWKAIHDPGHVAGDMTDNGGYRIDAEGVEQLAYVWVLNRRMPADGRPQADGPNFGSVQAGANAHLIAAAPDMLAVLKALTGKESRLTVGQYSEARAAIAKAEGRS